MGKMIEIDCICKDGRVSLDVQGAQGKECEDITKEIEKRIGAVRSRKYKPEYYNNTEVEKVQETKH